MRVGVVPPVQQQDICITMTRAEMELLRILCGRLSGLEIERILAEKRDAPTTTAYEWAGFLATLYALLEAV